MKTIHFNTRRLYSAKGQRISATRHDDGTVTFYDHDRMIDGESRFPSETEELLTDRNVMSFYGAGAWKSTDRSRQDGMCLGGVNTKYPE